MMGEAKPTWTRNKHDYLQLVNQAGAVGCRARGVAFGSACASLRSLGWVERVQAVGIKVRITELGRRALEAWDAGERGELDLRTDDERKAATLAQLLELSADHGLDERLLQALFQRVPVLAFQRLVRQAVVAAGDAALLEATAGVICEEAAPEVLAGLHSGGVVGCRPAGVIPRLIETGQTAAAGDPRHTIPAGPVNITVPITDPLPPAPDYEVRFLSDYKPPSFPCSLAPVVPEGDPEPHLAPAEQQDEPAEEWASSRCICPKCDGRGVTGPMRLDCTRCKGEGNVQRTVRM